MGWTGRFKSALGQHDLAPRYVVEGFRLGTGPRPGRLLFSSHAETGYLQVIRAGGIEGGDRRLTVGSWSADGGSWSVKLTADLRRKRILLRRGIGLRLRIGFAGWDLTDYETVEVGILYDVQHDGDGLVLVVRDLIYAMQARPTLTGGELSLYYDTRFSSTLTSSYTVGDGVLNVVAATGFRRRTGGNGIAWVEPAGGGGFFIGWSARTLTSLTTQEIDRFGTTRSNASIGDSVYENWSGETHPVYHALEIITSTGGGTNGAYDLLPKPWGLGIAKELVDINDAQRTRARTLPAGVYTSWPLLEYQSNENPASFLSSFLQPGGWFLAIRQGKITVRAALDINTSTPYQTWEITDDEIEDVESYSAFAASSAVEYRSHRVTTATSSTTYAGKLMTSPAVQRSTVDLSGRIWDGESQWQTEISDRLKHWSTRVPEEIVLRLRGWRLRAATVGDFARVTTRRVSGRLNKDRHGFSRRLGMITGVSGSWLSPWTTLTVTIIPRREDK